MKKNVQEDAKIAHFLSLSIDNMHDIIYETVSVLEKYDQFLPGLPSKKKNVLFYVLLIATEHNK